MGLAPLFVLETEFMCLRIGVQSLDSIPDNKGAFYPIPSSPNFCKVLYPVERNQHVNDSPYSPLGQFVLIAKVKT